MDTEAPHEGKEAFQPGTLQDTGGGLHVHELQDETEQPRDTELLPVCLRLHQLRTDSKSSQTLGGETAALWVLLDVLFHHFLGGKHLGEGSVLYLLE